MFDYLLKCYESLDGAAKSSLPRSFVDECRSQLVRNAGLVLAGVYASDKAYPNSSESILTEYIVSARIGWNFLIQLMTETLTISNSDGDILNTCFAYVRLN